MDLSNICWVSFPPCFAPPLLLPPPCLLTAHSVVKLNILSNSSRYSVYESFYSSCVYLGICVLLVRCYLASDIFFKLSLLKVNFYVFNREDISRWNTSFLQKSPFNTSQTTVSEFWSVAVWKKCIYYQFLKAFTKKKKKKKLIINTSKSWCFHTTVNLVGLFCDFVYTTVLGSVV